MVLPKSKKHELEEYEEVANRVKRETGDILVGVPFGVPYPIPEKKSPPNKEDPKTESSS
jgi:hypothetical protein